MTDSMIVRNRSVRTRLAVLSGGVALLAAGVTYLLPGAWAATALVVVVAGAGWLGWLSAGRALRPIKQIAATARRVDASNLDTRIGPGQGEAELSDLAATFDAMLARLEHACQAQRRFFADAVQAMKAPIAQQRALAQAAADHPDEPLRLDQAASLLELTERQERLVDELLMLARSETAVAAPVPVELADIAYRVSDGLEPEARRAGIEMRVSAGPARTPGDPELLERLAENLLQNAVRYNTADGWVRVATGTDGDTVHLTVANTGPVVPTGEVPTLFEPFHRLIGEQDCNAQPAGLGLSIVRSVAQAHGGQVSAAARDGGGLVVEVTLPAQ